MIISWHQLPDAVFGNVVSAILIAIALLNYRGIIQFIRRRIKPTDGQIIGTWYVSRYLKKNTDVSILTEKWRIVRDLSSRYRVIMCDEHAGKYGGIVEYNERERLNINITGVDHNQHGFVSFQLTIPRIDDSRMFGLGVGEDANYFLSARIYLASRIRYEDAYVRQLLDEAHGVLLSTGTACPLIQLPPERITAVLGAHSPPVSGAVLPRNGLRERLRLVWRKSG